MLMEDDSGEWRPWPRFDPAALVDEPSHTLVLLRKQQFCNGKGLSVSPAQVLGRGGEGVGEVDGEAILLPWPTVHLDLNLWGKGGGACGDRSQALHAPSVAGSGSNT